VPATLLETAARHPLRFHVKIHGATILFQLVIPSARTYITVIRRYAFVVWLIWFFAVSIPYVLLHYPETHAHTHINTRTHTHTHTHTHVCDGVSLVSCVIITHPRQRIDYNGFATRADA
jgi:hypothetical protein